MCPDVTFMQIIRNAHLWIISALIAAISVLYYAENIGLYELLPFKAYFLSSNSFHDLHRALFLIPMIYAAIVFRVKGAVATSFVVFCIVIPRGLFISTLPYPLLRPLIAISIETMAAVLLGLERDQRHRLLEETLHGKMLQEERSRLTRILNSVQDGIIIIGPDYDIEYVNPTLASEYGAADGQKCYQYFHGYTGACMWCHVQEVCGDKLFKIELHTNRIDKTWDIVWSPMKNADGSISKVGVLHDITDRKQVEQIKDEFIGMVSHELKTPLAVIIGMLSIADDEKLPPNQVREFISDAASSAHGMADLVDNLLELSRHQSGRLDLRSEQIDLGEIVRDVILKFQAKSAQHRLWADIPSSIPPVQADPTRMRRVLHNLVENAIKFSPRGGEVKISAHQQNSHMIIAVGDQGIGISPTDQLRLFQPFERIGAYEKHAISGLGLGLRVCQILVETQGGRIWLESESGKGSTFFFTVPLPNSEQRIQQQ